MDLTLDDRQHAFQAEVRTWLRHHVPSGALPAIYTQNGVQEHLAWELQLYEAGYAALHWPREFGGGGADLVTQSIFQEEYLLAGAPERLNKGEDTRMIGGGDSTDRLADRAAVAAAAVLVGIAAHLVEVTVGYVKQRHQFGRPVGSFQAVKHKLAEAHLAVEMARPAVWAAGLKGG
ncbi:acyl-CoA dehydrogenase family protein [Pengzhenrongella sp.]|jgi:alkylation response protein AidB-like acyl-CoA dehydrogenase|uniref:acyl-CoA dehydrogenase family protein n=1 Tax=Pengzhenrongella sp. TaxID=2888820 RepID=UPI002F949064